MGKRFVLLHGAWHGGWCWEGVIKHLEAAGHQATAPTMPGHHPADDRGRIKFQDYVDKTVLTLKAQPGPVVLVGHSSAGFIMQASTPLAGEVIEKMIFHNAFILADETSQFDVVPPEVSQGMTQAAQASPDSCVPVDEGFIRGVLMTDDSSEVQDALLSRLVPQPLALFTTKVYTQAFQELSRPRSVLLCKNDQSLPPGGYLGMAQNLGQYDLLELDGGHETLFTDPEKIARALLELAV